jgi:hypothetical protein
MFWNRNEYANTSYPDAPVPPHFPIPRCEHRKEAHIKQSRHLSTITCDILTQGLIGLIEYSYHQGIPSFPEAQLQITLGLSVLGLEQFQDEWLTGKFSRVCISEDKSAQKRLGLVYGASLWFYGTARSNNRQSPDGWGVTNGIRAYPCGFTGAYEPFEKDTVAYGSGTWVRTHDAWVL